MKRQNLFAYKSSYSSTLGSEKPQDYAAYKALMDRLYEQEMEARISGQELSERLVKNAAKDGSVKVKPLKLFSPEEQARREELSRRCRNNVTVSAGHYLFDAVTSQSRTYKDVLTDPRGTAEAEENNRQVDAVITAVPGDPKAILGQFLNAYRKLDQWNTMDFVTKDLSDEEMVDRQPEAEVAMQRILSISNTRNVISGLKNLDRNAPETVAMREELEEIMNRYDKFATRFFAVADRYSMIENPFYSVIDTNDDTFRTISEADKVNTGTFNLRSYDDMTRCRDSGMLPTFAEAYQHHRDFLASAELEAAQDLLTARGVQAENIMIRNVTDGEEPQPLSGNQAEYAALLSGAANKRLEVFDAADPTKRVVLMSSELGSAHRLLVNKPAQEIKAPKRPNPIKRLLHWVSRNAFKDEFDTYAMKKSEYENEQAKQEQIANGGRPIDKFIAKTAPRKTAAQKAAEVAAKAVPEEALMDKLVKDGKLTAENKEKLMEVRDAMQSLRESAAEAELTHRVAAAMTAVTNEQHILNNMKELTADPNAKLSPWTAECLEAKDPAAFLANQVKQLEEQPVFREFLKTQPREKLEALCSHEGKSLDHDRELMNLNKGFQEYHIHVNSDPQDAKTLNQKVKTDDSPVVKG